jgi:hypothetical protein
MWEWEEEFSCNCRYILVEMAKAHETVSFEKMNAKEMPLWNHFLIVIYMYPTSNETTPIFTISFMPPFSHFW